MTYQQLRNYMNIVLLVVLTSSLSFGQDLVKIKHTNYTTTFSKEKHYPVMVEWTTTKDMVYCPTPLPRKDKFKPDPQLPKESDIAGDYVKSGYDRGHVMPAADNLCQTQEVSDECFYFTNMIPQTHRLNAGDWKRLETQSRKWAIEAGEIHVWAGAFGEIKKIGVISVPEKCWKVVYIKSQNKWMGFLFNNDLSAPDGYENNLVDLSVITKLTGYTFK